MLFHAGDVVRLNRLISRKGYDTAMIAVDGSIEEVKRRAMVDVLVRQISTARMMVRIGTNQVEDLDEMLPILEEDLASFPVVTEADSEPSGDEAAFLGMAQWTSMHLIFLHEAVELCKAANCSIDDRDARTIMAVRSLMGAMAERCEGQDPEVLGDAADYIFAITTECGVLLRIHALKGVSSEEISRSVDMLDGASEDDFDALFQDVMDDAQAASLEEFRENSGRYVAAMYARCVQNARNPELEGVRSSPPSARGSPRRPGRRIRRRDRLERPQRAPLRGMSAPFWNSPTIILMYGLLE